MRGKRMSGKLKSITAFLLTLAMVFSIFAYLPAKETKADTGYILTFSIDSGATGSHTFENDNGHLKIDGQYVDLKSGVTDIGTVGVNENTATITVSNSTVGKLNFNTANAFDLYVGDSKITADTEFNSNTTIVVKDFDNSGGGGNDISNQLEVCFDHATVNGNSITFTVPTSSGDVTVKADVSGVTDGVAKWNDDKLNIDRGHLNDVVFTFDAAYNNENMGVRIIGANSYTMNLAVSESKTCSLGGLNIPDGGIHFEIYYGNGGGDNPQPAGNSNAVINLSGTDGSWQVNPMVRENYDTVSEEGCSAPYKDYAYTVSVSINGGEMTKGASQYNKDDKSYYATEFASQNITYNREDGDTTVDIKFITNWANRIESVKINGTSYNIPLNYDDRNSWLNAFGGQGIGFTIKNVPVPTPLDANNREVYNIEVKVRPITEEECFIGNFLWSNDDRMDPEVSGEYNDMYIGHSNLELISITYDDGKDEKTVNYEDLLDEDGNETIPFIHQNTAISFETGIEMSEMVVPEGSWVTMKIETKYGYQVKSFNLNGNDVRLGDTSVFSFRIGKGNFHIGAHVEKQEDEAKVKDDAVSEAAVELADGTLDTGSARLEVADADVSTAKKAEFESEADEAGYEIESYLDLSLNQVFYKGTGNSDDVWANPMNDLDNPATISLALSDDIDPEDVVIIHNIHNGNEFEVIETEYIEEYNAISFETDSFSDFAIATKTEEPTTPTKPDTPTKPETTYVSMYRLYNPNSGEHFYTSNVAEKNNLVNLGWNYEGVAWDAPKTSDTPVYRLYNPNAGDHHYTVSAGERDFLVNVGWNYEGIGWYSTAKDGAPLYRLYNPNAVTGTHHYTTSAGERDFLKSIGWNDEGIAWYGVK